MKIFYDSRSNASAFKITLGNLLESTWGPGRERGHVKANEHHRPPPSASELSSRPVQDVGGGRGAAAVLTLY